jgi:hypothetical protein
VADGPRDGRGGDDRRGAGLREPRAGRPRHVARRPRPRRAARRRAAHRRVCPAAVRRDGPGPPRSHPHGDRRRRDDRRRAGRSACPARARRRPAARRRPRAADLPCVRAGVLVQVRPCRGLHVGEARALPARRRGAPRG